MKRLSRDTFSTVFVSGVATSSAVVVSFGSGRPFYKHFTAPEHARVSTVTLWRFHHLHLLPLLGLVADLQSSACSCLEVKGKILKKIAFICTVAQGMYIL